MLEEIATLANPQSGEAGIVIIYLWFRAIAGHAMFGRSRRRLASDGSIFGRWFE